MERIILNILLLVQELLGVAACASCAMYFWSKGGVLVSSLLLGMAAGSLFWFALLWPPLWA